MNSLLVFHKIDRIVNDKYEINADIYLSESEIDIIGNYIENYNDFSKQINTNNNTIEGMIIKFDELIASVDESTGKLYRDLFTARKHLKQGQQEQYERAKHKVDEDYFKLRMYVEI